MREKILTAESPNPFNISGKIYEAYKKDFQNGMITVGNICSSSGFFCSQKWNPPGIFQNLNRFLTLDEIKHFSNLYLKDVNGIGSAIHNNSGEFFSHPRAIEILDFLALSDKICKQVPLFTNGFGLTEEIIKACKKIGLYLSFSLNSFDPWIRTNMMGGSYEQNKNAIDSIYKLDKYNVSYCIWIVPLKSNLENGDLERTIQRLNLSKASHIFIHLPGYTKYTPPRVIEELSISQEELQKFILAMREKYKIKIQQNFRGAG